MKRGKDPVHQRPKNHMGLMHFNDLSEPTGESTAFCYIHKCKSRKKKCLTLDFSRVWAWKSPLPSEHTQTLCLRLWASYDAKCLKPYLQRYAEMPCMARPRVQGTLTPAHEHVAAVLLAAAQLSGKSDGQEEATGADGVERTKQWAARMHPAGGNWSAGCQLHCVIIYRAHLGHSTVQMWGNWNWEFLSHQVTFPFSLALYSTWTKSEALKYN